MHLCRVQIKNFRNFHEIDVPLDADVVILGENRVGKSNFLYALRLVLDASLPDSARQLKLSDIWDGLSPEASPEVSIHLDFTGFDADASSTALLTDYRLAEDHTTARLSYVFRKRVDVPGPAKSEADFEFLFFGGGDENRRVRSDLRLRLCLDVLHALRDAESDLATWRSSPLRPLLEDAVAQAPEADLNAIAADVNVAMIRMGALTPIHELETKLRGRVAALAGARHDIRAKLQFAPTDPFRLFRSIRLFIDDGKRGIADASLGSANLALLALKLAEFEWRHVKNERNYTILGVEEPEAHLHPQLQRAVFQKLFRNSNDGQRADGLILTTHSPHIASVAPLRSILLFKADVAGGTAAYSLARLALTAEELEDLERYLDATRAELLFARAVLFVEGDAELALVPVFAQSIGLSLDNEGVTVCSVGGTNFRPYVKLAVALGLPFAVITDWDPLDGKKAPLGRKRCLDLIDDIRQVEGSGPLPPAERKVLEADDAALQVAAKAAGLFTNTNTFEIEVVRTAGIRDVLLDVLASEPFGPVRQKRLADWKADPAKIDGAQLLAMIADVGKGRLAVRISRKAVGLTPPDYIQAAVRHVIK